MLDNLDADCKKFMEMVESIAESSGKVEENDSKDATDAAELLGNLSVDEAEEEKASKEVSAAVAKLEEKPQTESKIQEPSQD